MDELISKEQALLTIKDLNRQYNGKSPTKRTIPTISVLSRIRDLPSVWILCSERLPEKEEQVLIYAESLHFVLAKYKEILTEGEYVKAWVTDDAYTTPRRINYKVIAWMPLNFSIGEKNERTSF